MLSSKQKFYRRKERTRTKLKNYSNRPRLTVSKTNKYIYCSLVDNKTGNVVTSKSSLQLNKGNSNYPLNVQTASEVGKQIGQELVNKGIKEVVFDKGGYKFHGKIKALAEAARETGLKF